MELLSSIMLLVLCILGRVMIWRTVGNNEGQRRVVPNSRSFSRTLKFDIRCSPSVAKRV